MRQVYLTSKENYLKINEKDANFPSKKGFNPNTIMAGTYKEQPLFYSDSEYEASLLKDIRKIEEVEIVRI